MISVTALQQNNKIIYVGLLSVSFQNWRID